ncbi:MAG: XRE family transcriptional regulator [Ignavibacteria bacterium]|nr:XRE family transcriptional regulator [Ignavibacteria bacterium]
MTNWNDPFYQKIKNVKDSQTSIIVFFENGDIVKILKKSLLIAGIKDIEWESLTYNPFEIRVPAKPNTLEIPWDKIRVLTDKEFSKYLSNRSEEQSRLIGVKLKQLREKSGLKGNEIAERTGLTPQTISRIEKGHTDVSFITLRKILSVMGFTLADLSNHECEADIEKPLKDFNYLLKRLITSGVDLTLLNGKIIPKNLISALNKYKTKQPEMMLNEVTSYVSSVYGWTSQEIWGNTELQLKNPATAVYFKIPANANKNQIKAYSHYAFYLSKLILKSQKENIKSNYPTDIEEFKKNYYKRYKTLAFEFLLDYIWSLGIIVIPLNDPGVFHGAAWNIDGKHIIILKQNTLSHARWIFDLLHELYHVFVHLDGKNSYILESEELSPFSSNETIEELEANSFANHFLLGPNVDKLATKCIEAASWKLENLKTAVSKISKQENIREDILANYLAFRLYYQGQNWWGTATKMQIVEPNPYKTAVKVLNKYISINKLNEIDQNLLKTAISD